MLSEQDRALVDEALEHTANAWSVLAYLGWSHRRYAAVSRYILERVGAGMIYGPGAEYASDSSAGRPRWFTSAFRRLLRRS